MSRPYWIDLYRSATIVPLYIISIVVACLVSSHASADIQRPAPQVRKNIQSLIDQSVQLADQSKLDSAILLNQAALNLIRQENLDTLLAAVHYSLGYAYDINGYAITAINHYDTSQMIYESLGMKEDVAHALIGKGLASYYAGNFEEALAFDLATLDYAETNNLQQIKANVLNNIGVLYRTTDKNDKALQIYLQVVDMFHSLDDSTHLGHAYQNVAVAYNHMGVGDSALYYLDSALHFQTLSQDTFEIATVHAAYADVYFRTLKDLKQSRHHLQMAESLFALYPDQNFLGKLYLLWGQLENEDNNPTQALKYFNKGIGLIEKTDREEMLMEYYEEIETVYHQQGKTDAAYDHLKKYLDLYKKIQNSARLEAIEELQTKYETEKKEQEIELLNSRNAIAEVQLSTRNRTLVILGIGLLALAALLFWALRLNKRLKKVASEKDTLLKEIHHRVKNNLQVVSALLTLQSKYIKDQGAIDALQRGQNRVESMALIHKNLYQHENLKGVDTRDYLERLVEHLVTSYQLDDQNIELELEVPSLNLDVDTMIPLGLIINELISNSLKHAFKDRNGGKIIVRLKEEDGQLLLHIADDGGGVKDQVQTANFGQSLVRSLVRRLNGELKINTEDGYAVDLTIKDYKRSA